MNVALLFLITLSLVLIHNAESKKEIPGGYPINRFECTYECAHADTDHIRCKNLCKKLGGSWGYCYWNTCYCEYLPDSVPQKNSIEVFSCGATIVGVPDTEQQ
ncbi:ikitoxin-like [Centruroides sculpturatus]|uniref:ikitoxin-like n=1 Tax=Centruroides sculpturatus TaxID=218467 RepID=UPI000C6CB086|nr:ikitoxin-like [Centruroides sculpturatus]